MIFQHTINKVLRKEKTQTRRPVMIYHDFNVLDSLVWDTVTHRTIYQIGKTYAAQPGRGKPAVARIRITGIKREDVRGISDEDVRAEGFDSYAEFIITWCQMHDKSYYRKLAKTEPTVVQRLFTDRPAERYDAWAITFELVKS